MSEIKNRIKAKELYQSGFGSLAKIAETLGENVNTVKNWKKRDKNKSDDWLKMGSKKSEPKVIDNEPKKKEIKKSSKLKKDRIKKIEDKLTEKMKLFAYYYITSFNATQSAIKAGYSKDTAFIIGHENLRKPKIKALILELREGFNEELHLDANRILNRHAKIAFSDTNDFVEIHDSKMMGTVVKLKNIDKIDGTLIKKIKNTQNGIELELEDRGKSLEFLSKYLGLNKEETNEETKKHISDLRSKHDL